MELFAHQRKTADLYLTQKRIWDMSDAGTGKTISAIGAFLEFRRAGGEGRMLVLAPLSILQPAWGNDIEKFTQGELTYDIAYAKDRKRVFEESKADVIITNHDAVKWMQKNWGVVSEAFPESEEVDHWLVIDEAVAFKNPQSQRSKAMLQVRVPFTYRAALSGTPNSKSILDLFQPTLIVDNGEHLGNKYFAFRNRVASPVQVGPDPRMVKWVDNPDSIDQVTVALADMTSRFTLEDCHDIPENSTLSYEVDLPPKLRQQYDHLLEESVLEAEDGGVVSAVHAGARVKKLLQLLTGAVYSAEGDVKLFHTDRYELVNQLVEEREQCLVAFNWRHEVEALTKLADKMGISYGVIDGRVPHQERTKVVERFQAGELKVIYAHPQSAGHGLTLTAGTTTIWSSPTYNAEHYAQFNRRIYRAGQKKKTSTIHITARDTAEEDVYANLAGKMANMQTLLGLFTQRS